MKKSKFFILTKYLLASADIGSGKRRNKSNNRVFNVLLGIFLFILLAISIGCSINFALYTGLKTINLEPLLLVLNYSCIAFVIFFFGIFYSMNFFYFSKDTDYLLPLPVKPEEIIASKFVVTVLYEYFIEGIVLIPCTLIYGIQSGMGILFYVYSIILMIFLPILPISIGLLISMIIMPFVNLSKNKDFFKILGGTIVMFFAFGYNIVIRRIGGNSSGQFANNIQSLSKTVGRIFPGGTIAQEALINSNSVYGFLQLLIFVLINVLSFVIILSIGRAIYFKGVVGLSESGSKRKKMDASEISKTAVKKSVVMAYTVKEIKLMFRTPAYFVNCILPDIIWPLVIIMPVFFGGSSGKNQLTANDIMLLAGSSKYGIIIAIACAFGLVIGVMNCVTCTSISREGENFFIMKYIPVPYKEQITAKILSGIIVAMFGHLLLVVTVVIIMKLPVYIAVMLFAVGLVGIAFSSSIGIIIDIYNPKLGWDNEQRAVKNNLNILFAVVPAIIMAAITIIAAVVFNPSYIVTFIAIVIIYAILDFAAYKIVCEKGSDVLSDYEA